MSDEILFKEKQRFKQWWIWIILLGVNALFLFGVFKQVIGGQQFGGKPAGNTELLIITGITLLPILFFITCHLDTIIKRDGIYVRFFPFHLKYKYYPWNTLLKSFVRQYSPMAEYGGWGLRFGIFGKGNAYNVSGNKGLQLEFMNNKKLLIGTKKPEELTETLKSVGQLKE